MSKELHRSSCKSVMEIKSAYCCKASVQRQEEKSAIKSPADNVCRASFFFLREILQATEREMAVSIPAVVSE